MCVEMTSIFIHEPNKQHVLNISIRAWSATLDAELNLDVKVIFLTSRNLGKTNVLMYNPLLIYQP
jgi:hypothetical protein